MPWCGARRRAQTGGEHARDQHARTAAPVRPVPPRRAPRRNRARQRRRHRAQCPLAGQELSQVTCSSTCAREKVSRGPGKRKICLERRPQSGRSARVDIEGARAAGPQRSQRPVRVTIRAPLELHRALDAERAKADLPTMSMSPARVCNVRRQRSSVAGAISQGSLCKCQRAAGASRGASGVSGPSGMIPRWPRRPLSMDARAGVELGAGKGGHGIRSGSHRWPN